MILKKLITTFFILLISAPLTFPATSQVVQTAPDFVVAIVDGTEIKESEIKQFYNTLPPQYRQMQYAEIRSRLVDQLVDQVLVEDQARRENLHKEPAVKQRILSVERNLLNEIFMQRIMLKEVTETAIRKEYQVSIAMQPKREEVRARHILLKTKADAMTVIKQLEKGVDFSALAKEKSTGPSGRNGGDLGYFGRAQMVPPFSKAAFSLNKGDFTRTPVKTQFGYHVIKVEDRRISGQAAYEQASAKIKTNLQNKVFEKVMASLRAKAKIEIKGGVSKIRPIR